MSKGGGGASKVLWMSFGKSKEKSIVERTIFKITWDQEKRDFELDGTHGQGIREPRRERLP